MSVEFQCILISNEFRSEYSHLAFSLAKSEARTRNSTSRTISYAHNSLLYRVLTSARISVTSIQCVFQIFWDGVDESTVLMTDQVAQAVIVLDLQAG